LRILIDAAIQAPSAMNEQPWSFCVVEDQALLTRASDAAKAHMLEEQPASGAASHIRGMLSDPTFHIFYHAPVLIVISSVSQGRWAAEDCASAPAGSALRRLG
jgi:nitroreductase